ncbi:MAG: hypothetical protein EPO65_02255 [Dehalococcoidia bacterium]|nr:MAG: hypothetical protein EPO65_02255 [Dehalococcoidia bacterium]
MQISKMTARASAVFAGGIAAALPMVALAAEPVAGPASRSLGLSGDATKIAFAMVGGLLALFGVATLGYLYRRERHLDWEFQKPDVPHH